MNYEDYDGSPEHEKELRKSIQKSSEHLYDSDLCKSDKSPDRAESVFEYSRNMRKKLSLHNIQLSAK